MLVKAAPGDVDMDLTQYLFRLLFIVGWHQAIAWTIVVFSSMWMLTFSWGLFYSNSSWYNPKENCLHYNDVKMGAIASQITGLMIVYSTVHSDADQGKHQSSASLDFVRGIPGEPGNSPHKWPVTRKMLPYDDVIMETMYFEILLQGVGKSSRYRIIDNNGILAYSTWPHRKLGQ